MIVFFIFNLGIVVQPFLNSINSFTHETVSADLDKFVTRT